MAKRTKKDANLQEIEKVNVDPAESTAQEKTDAEPAVEEVKSAAEEEITAEPAVEEVKSAAEEEITAEPAAEEVKAAAEEETAAEPAAEEVKAASEEETSADAEDAEPEEDAAGSEETAKTSEEIKKERATLRKQIRKERDEMKARSKEERKMRRVESKQRRTEMMNGVIMTTTKFKTGAKEMSDDLKQMLSKEIITMEHVKKTRPAEIWAIFAKHNFYMNGFTPEELRTTLEDLGPTYVKIGQIMSSRVDMLPESYCVELEKLRQNVKQLDPKVARAVIEQETGKKIEEIYSEFDDDPLGSASIGQVHAGTLLDGTKVVTKVQRPLIADMMHNDFDLLKKIASAVGTINAGKEDDTESLDLISVINELEKVTNEELDFRVEAQNTIFFKENCIEDETKISCPTIYTDLTTERIMTMSYVDGYSISKRDRLIKDGCDPNEIGAAIVDNYLHQVLDVGTFHADPHQGNIMVSKGIPYWIDFGMIGRLTEANIKMIQDLILAVIQTDTEALVNAAMAMGAASPKTDRAKLTDDLDGLISRYMSVTNLDELDTAQLLGDVTDIMSKHYIKIPGEYTMLIRSIATFEGVIEQLCPDLNLFKMITDKLLARVQQNFDIQKTLLDTGKSAVALGKKTARIPVLVADTLNSVVKGRAKINLELTGYQELMNQVSDVIKYTVLAIFSCVIFFGSCILCMTNIQPQTPDGMPVIAVAGFIFSVGLGIYTVKKLTRKRD